MQSSKTLMRYDCSKSGRLMEIFRPIELDNNEKQQLFEASEAETKMKNDQLVYFNLPTFAAFTKKLRIT